MQYSVNVSTIMWSHLKLAELGRTEVIITVKAVMTTSCGYDERRERKGSTRRRDSTGRDTNSLRRSPWMMGFMVLNSSHNEAMLEKLQLGSRTRLSWDVMMNFRRVTARPRRQNYTYYGIVTSQV